MMIGTKFGKEGETKFKLPDLTEKVHKGLMYCIASKGTLPNIKSESEEDIL